MKKIRKAGFLLLAASFFLFTGCGKSNENQGKESTKNGTDAMASASMVDDEASFKKAIGKDGSWIICLTKDIALTEDIVLEGDFTHNDVPARKIALYDQDETRKKTAVYRLEAPTLTIRSKNTRLQGGLFTGDVYVEAEGFVLADAKIDGNLYFKDSQIQETFQMDEGASVTGETKIKARKDVKTT